MGIDQSVSGTGVVIVENDTILTHCLIEVPSETKKYLIYSGLEGKKLAEATKNTKPYKAGLVDENWKRLKKAKDLTKEEKELFKLPQPLRIHLLIKRIENLIKIHKVDYASMESIAFGGSGQLASLGSVLGQIQYIMFANNVKFQVLNIAGIKKFATGKGNAQKETMIAATPDNDLHIFESYDEKKVDNIADAYWIARFIQENIKESEDDFLSVASFGVEKEY